MGISIRKGIKDIYGIFVDLQMPALFRLKYLANRLLIYFHYLSFGILPRLNLFPAGAVVIRNRDGLWKIVPQLGDGHVVSSAFEKELEKYFSPTKEGKILIDIGAHIGKWSVKAARRHYRVIAFEPDPQNFQLLAENIRLNNVEHKIKALNLAVSDKKATCFFKSHQGGCSKIVSSPGQGDIQVNATSLDSFVEEERLDPKEFGIIKIDVEGYETTVVAGMKKSLERLEKGTIVIIECGEESIDQITDSFKGLGLEYLERKEVNYIFLKR